MKMSKECQMQYASIWLGVGGQCFSPISSKEEVFVCQWPMQLCSASWMNWTLRLYRNESFFSGLQIFRWSTSTSISSPMPRSETRACQKILRAILLLHIYILRRCALFLTWITLSYLLTVMAPPVSWSWDRCLLVVFLRSSAPWIPSLWPCLRSSH